MTSSGMLINKENFRTLLNWLLVCIYCSIIYVLFSSAPPQIMPKIDHADKVVHFAAFVIMGILFFRAYTSLGIQRYPLILLTLASAALFGVLIEIRQYYLPHRSADGLDVAADVAGCLAGLAIWIIFSRIRGPKRKSGPETVVD